MVVFGKPLEVTGIRTDFKKEDFFTTAPYEEVLSVRNPFERDMAVRTMAEIAKSVGMTGFQKSLKAFIESQERPGDRLYIDGTTMFTGQPMELNTGKWRADDFGVSKDGSDGEDVACPHPIMPVERLVNIDTGVEKLRIAFSKGRKWRDIIVDKQTLASANKIVSLADMGISVTSENARDLVRYISDVENINYDIIPEKKSVGRCGYIDGEGFSPYVDDLVFDGDACYRDMFRAISSHGSGKEWTKIAKECRAMSLTARIVLAASFASVLVQPVGTLPFFVHVWGGESGTGKTVGLMLAASVWGNPQIGQYIKTFNATEVGHEKTAAFLNSLPMLIDELQLARDARGKIQFNVYSLAQGVGRTRGTKSGGVDKTPTWGNCILTTGESPLTTLSDGAGALNRVIDIECSPSEKVIEDGMRIANALKKNYGFAGKAFLKQLQSPGVTEAVTEQYQKVFRRLSESDTTEKQAMAAALIVVADDLITRWFFRDGDPLSAEQISSFLQTKASVSAGERGYEYMRDWVAQNSAKFRKGIETGDTYGLIEGDWAFIISKVFGEAAEVGGFSRQALLSYLKQRKLIQTRGKRYTVGKRVNSVVNTECVALLLTVPDTADGTDDFEEI